MGTPRFGMDYPDHLVNNNVNNNSNKKDIANMSKDIKIPTNASIYDYLGNRYNQNLFLTPVSEEEVIRTVNTWECKTSTDCDDINMHKILVKKSYYLYCKTYHVYL